MTPNRPIAHKDSAFRVTRSLVLSSILVVGLLASAGSVASAAPSVVDQYTEQLPAPGGEKSPDKSSSLNNGGSNKSDGDNDGDTGSAPGGSSTGTGGGESQGSGITPITTGTNGTPGSESTLGGNGNGPGKAAADGSVTTSPSAKTGSPKFASSAADGIVAGGGEGMGVVFPLILIGGLMAAGALFFVRRRGGSEGPSVN